MPHGASPFFDRMFGIRSQYICNDVDDALDTDAAYLLSEWTHLPLQSPSLLWTPSHLPATPEIASLKRMYAN
jgi:hypothetical protein